VHPITLEDLLDAYSGYPKRIREAILRAKTHPTITSRVTRKSVDVLVAFLTRASQRDGLKPLWARVDVLAKEANVSTKTVQRSIAAFREVGWLALSTEEARDENGQFCFRTYQFTPSFCKLVALPRTTEEPASAPAETTMSDGAVYVDLTFKEDQREISLQKHQGQPVTLPAELETACEEFGLKPTGMAKLRGIAHKAGHDLQAILTVARDYLKKTGATGNRAYRYLETMANKTDDYAGRASQVLRQSIVAKQEKETSDMATYCRHKQFVGPAGLRVKVFDGNAEVVDNGRITALAGPQLQQIYDRVKAGTLQLVDVAADVTAPRPIAVKPLAVSTGTLRETQPTSAPIGVPAGPRKIPEALIALRTEVERMGRKYRGTVLGAT
jgi:hypothetical protein